MQEYRDYVARVKRFHHQPVRLRECLSAALKWQLPEVAVAMLRDLVMTDYPAHRNSNPESCVLFPFFGLASVERRRSHGSLSSAFVSDACRVQDSAKIALVSCRWMVRLGYLSSRVSERLHWKSLTSMV